MFWNRVRPSDLEGTYEIKTYINNFSGRWVAVNMSPGPGQCESYGETEKGALRKLYRKLKHYENEKKNPPYRGGVFKIQEGKIKGSRQVDSEKILV